MIRSIFGVGVVLLLATTSAHAADWSVTNDKGVIVHTLKQPPYRIVLLCDPDKLWEDEGMHARNTLMLWKNDDNLRGPLKITNDGKSVTLAQAGVSINKSDNEADFIIGTDMLLSGKKSDLEIDGNTISITAKAVNPNTCK